MSAADLPTARPSGRAAVTRVVCEAADTEPVRGLLLEEAGRRGLVVDEVGPDLFVEEYLDTRDRRVHRAGTFLVRRDFGAASEIGWGTLRSAAAPGDVPPFGTSVALSTAAGPIPDGCPEPLRGALHALAGRHPLRAVLELDVRREEFLVKRDGRWIGTVVLLLCVATRRSPIAGVRFARVELRTAVDAAGRTDPFFDTLRERAGLRAVKSSAYEAALLAAAVPGPAPPRLGPTGVHLGITSAELAFAVMRKQFREIVRREPGARLGLDPEELHKLRVAVRRLRAALRLWRELLGSTAPALQREWGDLGRALGDVRDLDVELESLDAWSETLEAGEVAALLPFLEWVEARREEARRRMLLAMDSRRQERLARVTARWLREGRPLPVLGGRPARRDVARLVLARHRALRRKSRRIRSDSAPARLHRVRILAKHLRYCLEFHAEILGPDARRMIRHLVELQDLLGEIQDLHVSLDALRSLAEDRGNSFGPGTIAILEKLQEARRRQAEDLRLRFPETFAKLRGASWKRLKAELGART